MVRKGAYWALVVPLHGGSEGEGDGGRKRKGAKGRAKGSVAAGMLSRHGAPRA